MVLLLLAQGRRISRQIAETAVVQQLGAPSDEYRRPSRRRNRKAITISYHNHSFLKSPLHWPQVNPKKKKKYPLKRCRPISSDPPPPPPTTTSSSRPFWRRSSMTCKVGNKIRMITVFTTTTNSSKLPLLNLSLTLTHTHTHTHKHTFLETKRSLTCFSKFL